jgi:hypothetical protein
VPLAAAGASRWWRLVAELIVGSLRLRGEQAGGLAARRGVVESKALEGRGKPTRGAAFLHREAARRTQEHREVVKTASRGRSSQQERYTSSDTLQGTQTP